MAYYMWIIIIICVAHDSIAIYYLHYLYINSITYTNKLYLYVIVNSVYDVIICVQNALSQLKKVM